MSLLNHPSGPNEPFVGHRKWQQFATGRNYVASCLLGIFEVYHLSRLRSAASQGDERDPISLLQHHTTAQLVERTNYVGTEKTIRSALKLLEEKGFITIHSNPAKGGRHDRTKYFLFHPEVAADWIKKYERYKRNNLPSIQTVDLPELESAPSIQTVNLPGLESPASIQTVDLPELESSKREISLISGKSTVCTLYIREKESEKKEEDFSIFSEATPIDEDEEIPFDIPIAEAMEAKQEKDHPPSPPSADVPAASIYEDPIAVQNAQLYKLKKGEMGGGIRLKPNQARYPWNVGNNPLSIDPYFVRALIELNPTWISHDFNQPLTEDAIKHYLQKLTKPDQRIAAEDQLNTVWEKSASLRAQWAKEDAARDFKVKSLSPDTHPILKELTGLLDKHKVQYTLEFRDEYFAMGTPDGFSVEIRRSNGQVLHPMGRLNQYKSYVEVARNLGFEVENLFYSLGDMDRVETAIRCRVQRRYPEAFHVTRKAEQEKYSRIIEEETKVALAEFLASKNHRKTS